MPESVWNEPSDMAALQEIKMVCAKAMAVKNFALIFQQVPIDQKLPTHWGFLRPWMNVKLAPQPRTLALGSLVANFIFHRRSPISATVVATMPLSTDSV